MSGFHKISLKDELGQGSQIEGITNIGLTGKYYISRENFSTTISGITITFKQKLYEFYDETAPLLSTAKSQLALLSICPNPTIHKIKIKTSLPFSNITVYSSLGTKVDVPIFLNKKEIDISSLSSGVYYLKIQLKNRGSSVIKKVIKL